MRPISLATVTLQPAFTHTTLVLRIQNTQFGAALLTMQGNQTAAPNGGSVRSAMVCALTRRGWGRYAGMIGAGQVARMVELAWVSARLSPAVEEGAIEPAKPGGVGEDVDLGDLAVPDGEGHDRGHLSVRGHDGPSGPVD